MELYNYNDSYVSNEVQATTCERLIPEQGQPPPRNLIQGNPILGSPSIQQRAQQGAPGCDAHITRGTKSEVTHAGGRSAMKRGAVRAMNPAREGGGEREREKGGTAEEKTRPASKKERSRENLSGGEDERRRASAGVARPRVLWAGAEHRAGAASRRVQCVERKNICLSGRSLRSSGGLAGKRRNSGNQDVKKTTTTKTKKKSLVGWGG